MFPWACGLKPGSRVNVTSLNAGPGVYNAVTRRDGEAFMLVGVTDAPGADGAQVSSGGVVAPQ